jgi:hypothetical protein
LDFAELKLNKGVGSLLPLEIGDDLESLVRTIVGNEPSMSRGKMVSLDV